MPTWHKISLQKEDIERCWSFSEIIITGHNQYDRMMKSGLSANDRLLYRIKRTFAGKIGEMAFYRFLEQKHIAPGNLDAMFAIFEGETNVDKFDFQTADGATVDVKTAVFVNHKNIPVPYDQFCGIPKDFYVGTKLDIPSTIRDYDSMFSSACIKDIYICGFATRAQLQTRPTVNLGEFPCKAMPLAELNDINKLLAMF